MDGVLGAGVAGVVAGIGVAMPLGAVGVLLVQQAIDSGWAAAAGGACGVALVDALYATVALVAGAAVTSALAGHERAVQLAGAALLVAVATQSLATLARTHRAQPTSSTSAGPGAAAEEMVAGAVGARPALVGGRFFLLTLVNPLTAVYFVALAAGAGELVSGAARAGVFVGGVLTSSLIWQLTLVTAGALAGRRLGDRARTVTALGGNLLVLAYAARLGL